MARRLKPQDEGKPLVTPRGNVVGVLVRIDGQTAYVRPNHDLLTGYGSWIGGPIQNVELFRLNEESVAEIASDRVHLGRDDAEPSPVNTIE